LLKRYKPKDLRDFEEYSIIQVSFQTFTYKNYRDGMEYYGTKSKKYLKISNIDENEIIEHLKELVFDDYV
ncbi:7177_t:CDS:2, partial [Racocetra persica]